MLSFLIPLVMSTFIHAVEPAPAPPAQAPPAQMPNYQSFSRESYDEMDRKSPKANEVNNSFNAAAAKVTNDVSHYLRAKRDELYQLQQKKRKEFEDTAKKEVEAWRAAHPGMSASDFMKEQGLRRKAMADKFDKEKKEVEIDLNDKKTKFDHFMSDARKEFRARYNSYVDSLKIKPPKEEDAVKKEFKDIPKGPGTVLAPQKDPVQKQ